MLTCRACLWRCIQGLDTAAAQPRNLRPDALATLGTGQQRSLHTVNTGRYVEARPAQLAQVEKHDPWKNSAQAASQRQKARASVIRPRDETGGSGKKAVDTHLWMGKKDPRVSNQEWNARKKELQYLKDPLEVANFVKKELGKGKVKEMVQLVRMASHSMQCIVSWNHIIDHYLAKERVTDALKIYNEMKKRAQFPDSYTYTILLRGLSINAHQSGALSKAIAAYHSMSAPNSRVEPTIIHTNAVLRVCARALDMDALWGIAGKIPQTGPRAANTTTYTTILNAIRQSLLVDVPKDENERETAARRERGIIEGRRIWEEIIGKWRNADLEIEEELVCAMGRLLLVGSRPRDWDDVLSLVEQTMDIPRLVPRLGTLARQDAGVARLRAPHVPEEFRYDDDHLAPNNTPVRGDEFLALTSQGVGSTMPSSALPYATPSNNTLSLVQEACQKIVATKAAHEYWEMLTDPITYKILPDMNNLHQRLRILRQTRASAAAVRVLKDEFIGRGNDPKTGTFRIAMSTCVRDKNNHNSLKHASEILLLMGKVLPDADPKTVTMYADLALSFPLAKGEDLVDALTILHPVVKNLRLQLGVGREPRSANSVGAHYLKGPERQDAIGALRKVYGVYDKLLFSDMIPEERKRPFKAERARLSSFMQRITFNDGRGKWDLAKEALDAKTEPLDTTKEESNGENIKTPRALRARKALPAGKRKPWFSILGAKDAPSVHDNF